MRVRTGTGACPYASTTKGLLYGGLSLHLDDERDIVRGPVPMPRRRKGYCYGIAPRRKSYSRTRKMTLRLTCLLTFISATVTSSL